MSSRRSVLIVLVDCRQERHPDRGFARELNLPGRTPVQAAIEASRVAARPI